MKSRLHKIIWFLGVLSVVGIMIFPVYWMLVSSFDKPGSSFGKIPELLPSQISFQSFVEVFEQRPLMIWLRNSLLIAVSSTVLSVMIASSAAYSLSRYRFRGQGFLASMIMVSQMLPSVLLVIPMYVLFKQMELLNSFISVIVAHISMIIPLCLFMMKGYIDSIDKSIDEAAAIDGCSRFKIFLQVVLPISMPGIAATGIYSFIQSWDEYLYARTFITTDIKFTASVGLSSFIGQYVTLKEHMMAASFIVTFPILIVVFFFQRYLISGLTEGATKG